MSLVTTFSLLNWLDAAKHSGKRRDPTGRNAAQPRAQGGMRIPRRRPMNASQRMGDPNTVSPPLAGDFFDQVPTQVPKMSHNQVLDSEAKARQFAKGMKNPASRRIKS